MKKIINTLAVLILLTSCSLREQDDSLKNEIKDVLIHYIYNNIDQQTAYNPISLYCQKEVNEFTYVVFEYNDQFYYSVYENGNHDNIIVTPIKERNKDHSCWSINNKE